MTVLPFCSSQWIVRGSHHACLKKQGHDGSCWCCDDYPGGDLSKMPSEEDELGSDT